MILKPQEALRLAAELLQIDDDDGPPDDTPGGSADTPGSTTTAATAPRPLLDLIGHYRVLRLIGSGGMGDVYEAEQESPRRRVAVKVVRPELVSDELRRRFEHEARILARLQHPGIAQIFEAGQFELKWAVPPGPAPSADDAAPPSPSPTPTGRTAAWFAMEFVEGRPLTRFAADHNLDLRARLDLFLKVCDAVEHAHRRGVIHRDLKPANILVDSASQPRILDFGVARATDADIAATTLHTEAGRLLGTLPYMSPEQVGGDPDALDTRSDVYALGVTLYELLAGRLPHDIAPSGPGAAARVADAARKIRETDPTPLSSINKTYRGDVETIVAKALEKDRERRYQSVSELAADVRRYLDNEPIVARRPSAWYELKKFAHRHKPVVVATSVAFVALTVTAGIAIWQAVSATRALSRAESAEGREAEQRQIAEGSNDFLESIFLSLDPARHGKDVKVAKLLDEASDRLKDLPDRYPLVQASMHHLLGVSYRQIALYGPAIEHLDAAVQEFAQLGPVAEPALSETRIDLAFTYVLLGNGHAAEDLCRKMIAAGSPLPAALSIKQSRVLAAALRLQGKHADAEGILRPLIARATNELGPTHKETLAARTALATLLNDRGRSAEAAAEATATLALLTSTFGADHPDTLSLTSTLANSQMLLGNLDQAEETWRSCLEREIRVFGKDNPYTLRTKNNLAVLLLRRSQTADAIAMLQEVLDSRFAVLGPDHKDTLLTRSVLARALLDTGREDEALAMIRQTLETQRRVLGPDHPDTIATTSNLASVLLQQGKLAEAEPLAAEAMEKFRHTSGEAHTKTLMATAIYVQVVRKQGRAEEARTICAAATEKARAALPQDHWMIGVMEVGLGQCLTDLGQFEQAEQLLSHAVQSLRDTLGLDNPSTQEAIGALASLCDAEGKTDEAKQWRAMLSRK